MADAPRYNPDGSLHTGTEYLTDTQLTLETWEQKCLRLAQEYQAARRALDPFKSTRKQRERLNHANYALHCHLKNVPEPCQSDADARVP